MSSEPDGPTGGQRLAPALELDRVSFGYGRQPLLREASVGVAAGELVAVIGANGAGKSTLMRLALGLVRPSGGQVRLFGEPLGRFRDWGKVGYVPQRASGPTALPVSVEEVVRSGLAGQLGLLRRPAAAHRARIEQVLALTGMAPLRRRPLAQLSGGERQRALIARALVTDPRLLILDEPATGVDADARSALRETLAHLVVEQGVAVVYVSHDPEGFAGLAHRVVEIRAGQAVRCDDPAAHGHPHASSAAPSAGADPAADPAVEARR